MKYYVIAGERSGDLHGSNLLKAIKQQDPQANFQCWGGDAMKDAGGILVKHYQELAFMGFLDVLLHVRKILKNLDFCKKDILAYQPDVIILIDYAGFNMRIAKFCKENKFKTVYYISPKVWAWNQSRAWKIKKYVDQMLVILPFEKDFFKKYDYDVEYVGNPLVDAFKNYKPNSNFKTENSISQKPIIAILPGSRKQEVKKNLKKMLSVVSSFPTHEFIVAGVSNLPSELYQEAENKKIKIVYNQTYNLLAHAEVAIVVSGTATLETALFEVPQIVCYEMSLLNYILAKLLVKVKFASLVNLLAGKEVVKELIKYKMTKKNIEQELQKILEDKTHRENMINEYKKIKYVLGTDNVSEKAANAIINYLKQI